jgi:hypothetical protein
MRADPKCVIDGPRAGGACIAPSSRECPYAHFVDSASWHQSWKPTDMAAAKATAETEAKLPSLPAFAQTLNP